MQIFLIIIVSLLVGFSAGYRIRRKKLENIIVQLSDEIEALKLTQK